MPDDDPWGQVRGEIDTEVRRVSDRLRTLSAARLAAPPTASGSGWPPYTSCTQAGRAAAIELSQAAQALEAATAGSPYAPRDLPELPPFAVGDQVAVAGRDLLAAVELVGPGIPVWWPGESNARPTSREVVMRAAALLTDVRRRI